MRSLDRIKRSADSLKRKAGKPTDSLLLQPPHRFLRSTAIPILQRQNSCVCGGSCPHCLGVIQPKFAIFKPNDPYQQEADRVAEKVMPLSEPYMQRQLTPRCTPQPNILKTWKSKTNPPRRVYYGASYYHTFNAAPKGCSLRGVEVSEEVVTERDDFQIFPPLVKLGKNRWTLTRKNTLNKPDSIWTPVAGPKGLGSKPLLAWPAYLRQIQRWFYRYSAKDSWKPIWAHKYIYVKLDGNQRIRKTQEVTTWVAGGTPRRESYRGPPVRVVRRRPRP